MPTNVRLNLKGLLVLDAKPGRTTGKVGILHAPPPPSSDPKMEHKLIIKVARVPNDLSPILPLMRPNVGRALSLQITNGLHPTISLRNQAPVDRHQPAMQPESFRWFVDLENSRELYDKPIGTNGGFESLLTFNGGEIYTADRPNESILEIQPRRNLPYEPFGRVALTLGVDFLAATRAVFKNGDVTIFDSQQEEGHNYVISITHDAEVHPPTVEDANHYYTVLGTNIPENERILFRSRSEVELLRERLEEARLNREEELAKILKDQIDVHEKDLKPPIGPEAACFTAFISETLL